MLNDLQGAVVLRRLPAGFEADDPLDAWLLALASAATADYLVTGDRRSGLLARGRVGGTRILTASAFCEIIA